MSGTYLRKVNGMAPKTFQEVCGIDTPEWIQNNYKIIPRYPRDMMIYESIDIRVDFPDKAEMQKTAYPNVTERSYLLSKYTPACPEPFQEKLQKQVNLLATGRNALNKRKNNAKHLFEIVHNQYFHLKHFFGQGYDRNQGRNMTTEELEIDCFWIAAACLLFTTGANINLTEADSAFTSEVRKPFPNPKRIMKWRPLVINRFLYEQVFRRMLPDPPNNNSRLFSTVTFPCDLMGLVKINNLSDNTTMPLQWFPDGYEFSAKEVPLYLFEEELYQYNLTEEARTEVLGLCPFCFIVAVQVAFYWNLGINGLKSSLEITMDSHPAARVATKLAFCLVTQNIPIPAAWNRTDLHKSQYVMMILNVNAKKWLEEDL